MCENTASVIPADLTTTLNCDECQASILDDAVWCFYCGEPTAALFGSASLDQEMPRPRVVDDAIVFPFT